MTTLNDLEKRQDLFFDAIPQLPMGRYVHFVLLRETESFPIFQTDGTLNVIRMQAGLGDEALISRLVMFKRKQSSPERLTGRELLRQQGIISDEKGDRFCEYNSANFCKSCPDCIHYGFAIGDAGAEKSKVYTDSAFSITPYEESHKPSCRKCSFLPSSPCVIQSTRAFSTFWATSCAPIGMAPLTPARAR